MAKIYGTKVHISQPELGFNEEVVYRFKSSFSRELFLNKVKESNRFVSHVLFVEHVYDDSVDAVYDFYDRILSNGI